MATPTDICNMAISRLGQPKINDISENSAAAIACRDHFEPVRDALLRGHPWNFATVRADLAEGATPEYGWSRSFTLPNDFLRLNTVNGVEASRCEADYSLTFRTIYSNADTLQVTYVKQIEDTTLFDPLFVEAFVLKLAAAIAPSIADPTEKGAMEALSAGRLRDAAFADASENRSIISTTSMGAASRYYRPQAVAFDAWGPSVGIKGGDGWTPLISLVNDAGREVIYVYDWTGGDGIAPKPGIGYIGRYGIVSNIADGVDITGQVGPIGPAGPNSISTATLSEITGILKGAAGNVAAAIPGTDYVAIDDSRLSDARTPTSHASTHVTGGADKIRDATASQDGLMTSAFATKLDGIATNANNYVHPNHSGDVTSVADGATTIANNAVTYAKLQDVSASSLVLGRKTAGAGDPEECSLSEVLDFVGSAAQGDLLYRGSAQWTRLPAGTSGRYLKTLGAGANPEWSTLNFKGQLGITIDGAGTPISSGLKGYLRVPYSCTINSAQIVATAPGDISIDIWKDSFVNFPPAVTDSITASAPVSLSSAQASNDSTLTGWTTSIQEGDYLAFYVNAPATVSKITLSLEVTRT